jgi:hypothetical protein
MSGRIEQMIRQTELDENHSSLSSAERDFETDAEAERVFSALKTKLLNIGEWNDHGMISSFELFGEDGRPAASDALTVGAFIRILLKGSGKYDWVQVEDIYDAGDEFIVTVKPTFDPTVDEADRPAVSHFFTDEARNNFCLLKKRNSVTFYVIGLNEKQNTAETDGALETVRNVAVNVGSYFGIQKGEWTKFSNGFMECAIEEVRPQE